MGGNIGMGAGANMGNPNMGNPMMGNGGKLVGSDLGKVK